MDSWLVTIAQLPTEDPAARMRVLRTLESLGAGVMREGAYLLPDTAANRQALEKLSDYIVKSAGAAQVLRVSATTPAQQETLRRLFDRSARYEALIKTVESLRVGFGHSDPSAISRVLHKQRREFEAIAALDFFPTDARTRAEQALHAADAAVKKLLFASSQTSLRAGERRQRRARRLRGDAGAARPGEEPGARQDRHHRALPRDGRHRRAGSSGRADLAPGRSAALVQHPGAARGGREDLRPAVRGVLRAGPPLIAAAD